ncbi:MAG: hypothetical protein ACTS6G_04250 [Candidatus Hodgkinia cicadicola]
MPCGRGSQQITKEREGRLKLTEVNCFRKSDRKSFAQATFV